MTPKNFKLSVVVPVYRSEASLPLLIARLKPELERIATDYEVLLVNDASDDKNGDKLNDFEALSGAGGVSIPVLHVRRSVLDAVLRSVREALRRVGQRVQAEQLRHRRRLRTPRAPQAEH